MTRWKITIEYDGRPYAGFQIQPDIKTVQGELQKAIKAFCQQDIAVTVAGRTDSGVHARGQVAHFDLDYCRADGSKREMSGHEMAKAMNAHLVPQPISVIHAEEVLEDFHARFGAKHKLYSYHIINRPYMLALDQGRAWWRKTKLDVAAMQEAAKILIGKHDFTTFRDTECQAKSPVRTVDALDIETHNIIGGQEIIMHAREENLMNYYCHAVTNVVPSFKRVPIYPSYPKDF